MSKTQWEGHTRVPRTWLLDDGSTILEPLLERTTGGRRVRSMEDPTLTGSNHDASNVAFTAVVRKVRDMGRVIVCEAHDLAKLKARTKSKGLHYPAESPLLHLTNDYYAVGEDGQRRMEMDKTRFWTTWEHPTLPIHFVSVNGIETSYYYADTIQTFYHLPLFPALNAASGGKDNLYVAPSDYEVASTLSNATSSNPFLYKGAAHWDGFEFFQQFPPGMETRRVVEGRREALRLMLIAATQISRMDTLEVPDVWSAVLNSTILVNGVADWDDPPTVELRKTGSNITDDAIESFKAYVTGADAAQKAAKLYKELRTELTHAGIVLGEVSEDQFIHMLTNTTKPFTTTITGARNVAEGKATAASSRNRRAQAPFSEQHEVVVDLVTGFVTVGCPHGDNPEAIPKIAQEAWDEAHTIAALSGKTGEFIEFASEYLRIKAENKVLTEALARRK